MRGGGKVFIVGAGPGDPELLTLKAARLIATADDLVVDALVPPALYQDSPARVIYVGKRAGRPRVSQEEIHAILVSLAHAHRRVVRLKGGDPGLFGRGAEEMRALEAAEVPYEVVPGVSSALAVSGAVGLSLTDREVADRVLILTGHRRTRANTDPVAELPAFDPRQTLVLVMALGHLDVLVERALAAGYPPALPAAVVSHATLPTQDFVAEPLEHLPAAVRRAGLATPATVVVGRVVEAAMATGAMVDSSRIVSRGS